MALIGDIVISRIIFDGKRFKTAKEIAMEIRNHLADQRVDHFLAAPI